MEQQNGGLSPFPELRSLGKQRIQELCDLWLDRPEAKEFGLAGVQVTDDVLNLHPKFEVYPTGYDKGEPIFFPFDRVIKFIIEHGCKPEDQHTLKNRLAALRAKVGPNLFQRFNVNVQAYTIALRCPACNHGIKTQWRVFEGQEFRVPEDAGATCPACKLDFDITDEMTIRIIDPDYLDARL